MKEQIEQNMNLIVEKLIKATEITVDFSNEQLPILIKEILCYNFAASLVTFLVFFFLTVFAASKVKGFWEKEKDSTCHIDLIPFIVLFFIGGIMSVAIAGINLNTLLQITLAPRLYLLEYLKTFLR